MQTPKRNLINKLQSTLKANGYKMKIDYEGFVGGGPTISIFSLCSGTHAKQVGYVEVISSDQVKFWAPNGYGSHKTMNSTESNFMDIFAEYSKNMYIDRYGGGFLYERIDNLE